MDTHTFRKGDRVLIEAVVDFVIDDQVKIIFDGLGSNTYVSAAALDLIMPAFHPGERVVHANGGTGVIIALHNDLAWVDMGHDGVDTLFAADLTLAPVAPVADTAAEPPSIPPDITYSRFALENAADQAEQPEAEF